MARSPPLSPHAPAPSRSLRNPPKEVHNRLIMLAIDPERAMNDLIAEALEDLFAKHNKRPVGR